VDPPHQSPVSRWPILQLVQYLARLSPSGDAESPVERSVIERIGLEGAVEALEADVGAVVRDGQVAVAVGFGTDAVPTERLLAAAELGTDLEVPGLGPCRTVAVPMKGEPAQLVLARAGAPFDAEEATLARALAGVLVISLRTIDGLNAERELRAQSERQAAEALTDPLTRLANRTLFLDRFEHTLALSRRSGARVAVLFMDLDRFKTVNDSLGHGAGDELLVQVAQRMRAVTRPGDTLARLGGDEFAVLIEDVVEDDVPHLVAERLLAAIAPPVVLDGRTLHVGMSIGIACGTGADATAETLLRDADLAMYEAKAQGNASYVFFEPEMHRSLVERLELEADLGLAIDAGELSFVYQPVVMFPACRVVGLEALLRWDHPTRGRVPPSVFIPAAEECGAIFGLSEWVLEQACSQLARWRARHPAAADLNVAVNISARELEQPDLVERVGHALKRTGLDPSSLVLEITETSVPLDDTARVAARLEALRDMGTVLALDDFGTGHSSIAHLRSLPAAIVKVDRTFVAEIATSDEHRALANGILSLGGALGLDTVAEGVETPEQLELLRAMGCGFAQGYLFSAPLTVEAIDAALAGAGSAWVLEPGGAGSGPPA
jgi:diguanylate cyclase (GGDEF)-like protein